MTEIKRPGFGSSGNDKKPGHAIKAEPMPEHKKEPDPVIKKESESVKGLKITLSSLLKSGHEKDSAEVKAIDALIKKHE